MSDEIEESEWSGCYKQGWTGLIVPEAFAHPAKYSRALIRRIYDHVIEEGWVEQYSTVIDPFGGVALGALDAMLHDLNWTGCELEAKFHALGNQNIALWNDRYSRMPQWGTARLLNGDSRKLASVIAEANLSVSSPPYIEPCGHGGGKGSIQREKSINEPQYGHSPGQIAELPEGDLQCAISSPPYAAGEKGHPSLGSVNNDDWGKDGRDITRRRGKTGEYGETDGQLASMPNGDHSIAISSPPYNKPFSQDHNGSRGGGRSNGTAPSSERGAFIVYGNTPGQLEGMKMGEVDVAISSPPFPQPYTSGGGINVKGYGDGSDKVGDRTYQSKGGDRSEGNLETMEAAGFDAAISSPPFESTDTKPTQMGNGKPSRANGDGGGRNKGDYVYGASEGQLGIERGETFWSASRTILEQLHSILSPDAHAVFVVKSFVRNKQIVDFPAQWAQLCEAVGFRLIHDHHALLTEEHGEQHRLDGGTDLKTVARKSFFRRLAESKGSPKIDYENVLCFERIP